MSIDLSPAQERTFRAALAVAPDRASRERLAFAIWTESRGLVYANDGRNTSRSPGVTPAVAEILRRSLSMPHDMVGSNGRSTGPLQQISADVGGGWGDMAGTMDPAISARRFLAALPVTDNPVYTGTLVTPTGSRRVEVTLSSPIAADVLRVQQPLADEAESSNYGAAQVSIAVEIAARFSAAQPDPTPTPDRAFLSGLLGRN